MFLLHIYIESKSNVLVIILLTLFLLAECGRPTGSACSVPHCPCWPQHRHICLLPIRWVPTTVWVPFLLARWKGSRRSLSKVTVHYNWIWYYTPSKFQSSALYQMTEQWHGTIASGDFFLVTTWVETQSQQSFIANQKEMKKYNDYMLITWSE